MKIEHLGRKVKATRLFNKTVKIRNTLYEIMQRDLQFQGQNHDTRTAFYTAYDSLKKFLDNLE